MSLIHARTLAHALLCAHSPPTSGCISFALERITVLAAYQGQVALIRQKALAAHFTLVRKDSTEGLRVCTIDQFQVSLKGLLWVGGGDKSAHTAHHSTTRIEKASATTRRILVQSLGSLALRSF
jgi:hypothetical protein